jgi:hypothetical protein
MCVNRQDASETCDTGRAKESCVHAWDQCHRSTSHVANRGTESADEPK